MNVRDLAARIETPPIPASRTELPGSVPAKTGAPNFAEQLRRAQEAPGELDFKVSAHARQRIQERGISLNSAEQHTLSEAMAVLDQKGARNALVLRSDAAFLVNVPNRTIVTAIGETELRDRVFTQIDSTMLV
jgi:flagellar operon protein